MKQFEKKEPSFDSDYKSNSTTKKSKSTLPIHQRCVKRSFIRSPFLLYWLNLIFFFTIGFSLLGIDFVLFASSGAGSIYEAFPVLQKEIIFALGGIASITGLIYFFLSGFSFMLSILTGFIMYMFGIAMFNHFTNAEVGDSEFYISLALAVTTFLLLFFSNRKIRFFFACAAAFAFGAVLYHQNYDKPEFVTENTVVAKGMNESEGNHKLVHIMLPNLPSYSYIVRMNDDEANRVYREQLRSIMLGFYANYGFKIYPDAYVSEYNPYLNAANSLNMSTPENKYDNLQMQVMKDGYWQFKNRNDFEVYLKNSKMIDMFKEQGYAINAYQSHGINICRKANINNVSRCVTRVVNPVNMKSDVFENTAVLAAQWLESSGWFNSLASVIYSRVAKFYDPRKLPIISVPYKSLNPLGSLNTLDLVAENMIADKGKQAYFIFLDMPSDMFIYDDMCRLKPLDEWFSKNNKPWVGRSDVFDKRSAYMQQSMCIYGKLSEFMNRLKKSGLLDDAIVIIQGLNGLDDTLGDNDDSVINNFLNRQMTDAAIMDSKSKKFTVNKSICAIPDIINGYFGGEKCTEFMGLSYSKTAKQSIRDKLGEVKYNNDIAKKSYLKYQNWMKAWNEVNYKSISSLPKDNVAPRDVVPVRQPQMQPLEEKSIGKQKVMSGQINVAPEAKMKPLSEVALVPVPEEQSATDELFPPADAKVNEDKSAQ